MSRLRTAAAAAVAALAVASLAGCTVDSPETSPALPSDPICQSGETPDSCLDGVRLALQSAFVDTADRGSVTHADYERIVSQVVSAERLGGDFSYTLLTELVEGVDDADPVAPRRFRVAVPGASGTWWLCPERGRVQTAACD